MNKVQKYLMSSARLSVILSVAAVGGAGVGAWLLSSKGWHSSAFQDGVATSLFAAGGVGLISAVDVYFRYRLRHRPYEAMFDAGVQRVFPRGKPGAKWNEQFRDFSTSIVFYGKDHSRLLKDVNKVNTLKNKLSERKSAVFYLLSLNNSYYDDSRWGAFPKAEQDRLAVEKKDRIEAAQKLLAIKNELGTYSHYLELKEFNHMPTFSYRCVDEKVIIFGPYLHNVPNHETLEFEIEPQGEFYEICRKAFEGVAGGPDVCALQPPP